MSAAEANPLADLAAIDQFEAAVAEAERGRNDNAHLYRDELIGPKVEQIMTEYGPATECVELSASDDRDRRPVETGMAGAWTVRWFRRPSVAYKVWHGYLDVVLDKVVPLRHVTVCDRCDRDVPPRWILLFPTLPSHLVFLVCEGCREYLAGNCQPVRFDGSSPLRVVR